MNAQEPPKEYWIDLLLNGCHFGGLFYLANGSNDGTTWSLLYSTTVKGANGETITSVSSNLTAGNFQQHRLAIAGSGGPIYCAQLATQRRR